MALSYGLVRTSRQIAQRENAAGAQQLYWVEGIPISILRVQGSWSSQDRITGEADLYKGAPGYPSRAVLMLMLMKQLPKIQVVPLGKIRRNETWLSHRDGNNAVPTSQIEKTYNSQGMGQRTQEEDLASVLGNTALH